MKKMLSAKFTIWSVVMVSLISSLSTYLYFNHLKTDSDEASSTVVSDENGNVGKIVSVYETLTDGYYQEVDEYELFQAAIRGMISSLDDPYTSYYDIEQTIRFEEEMSGSYEGIGVSFIVVDGIITVDTPRKGSPAEASGILPNDQFIEVDGVNIVDMDIQEIVAMIRGEKGTAVELGIRRSGNNDLIYIEVVRDVIPIDSIYSGTYEVGDKTIGYLDITQFIDTTYDEMVKHLNDLGEVDGLIIDLRRNPGGYLHIVEKMMDYFVEKGEVIYNIEDDEEVFAFYSESKPKYTGEMVILIDEGSASASEIFSATLNEVNGVDLIGQTSFGKGTVQSFKSLDDGSSLKFTTQKWLTPNRIWIHKNGVKPTIEVSQPSYFYLSPITLEESLGFDQVSDKIRAMQEMLVALGYGVRIDGYFDQETVDALTDFQESHDLSGTGVLDVETASALQAKILTMIQDEKNDNQLNAALGYWE